MPTRSRPARRDRTRQGTDQRRPRRGASKRPASTERTLVTTYRTREPHHLHQWKQILDKHAHHRRVQINTFLATHLLPTTSTAIGDETLLDGLVWDQEPLPAGWRAHRSRAGVICPDQSTEEGQRLAQDLGQITHTNWRLLLPGSMPPRITTTSGEVFPQLHIACEALWVIWSAPLPEATPIDPYVWELVR